MARAEKGEIVSVHGIVGIGLMLLMLLCAESDAQPLVYNGSFEEVRQEDGVPDGWATAGRLDIQQRFSSVEDPERGRVAKLTCTHFVGGTPDAHAMIAQLDRVGVRRGRWYRLSLWARASDLEGGVARVALANRRVWTRVGLSGSFAPVQNWKHFEFIFQAEQDLRPEDSRLQIWFSGTGTLWLDEVEMEQMAGFRREWRPVLPAGEAGNVLPNSSFECGGTGWGCWAPGVPGWGGQLFRLDGEWEEEHAFHGRRCWKLSLSPEELPVVYFDYYEPIEEAVRAVLLGHEGWVGVKPGQSYVFSAYVRADRSDLPVRIAVWEDGRPRHERAFSVGRDWQRVEFAFTAQTGFACGLVGLDLREADRPEGTIWLDALQFEPGTQASDYRPRQGLEACVETDRTGNIFVEPEDGLSFRLRAFNATQTAQTVRGVLSITDFLDRTVWQGEPELVVGPGQSAELEYREVLAGRRGFFRLSWQPENGPSQDLRCALIEPSPEADSVFGMNHAFSWEFLLRLSHLAGVRWWRDWSVKWHTVQPEPDGFDFRVPDAQIERVFDVDGKMLVMFPFPSAPWATTPDMEKIRAKAGDDGYLRRRLPTAFKPDRLEDWAEYVKGGVGHYWPRVCVFEILNEPVYTSYALPAEFGYSVEDYIDLLRTAYQAAKSAAPDCLVMGGIGGPPGMSWTERFIEEGGLQWCDILNYHIYPHQGWPESYEAAFRDRWEQILKEGGPKPIWMTEFGVYGDDTPPFSPYHVGDATMTNALRPGELEAAADLVRFAAIFGAYGVRKTFYHAGTCAALHRSSAGNMFFDYGGTPRKQYAAQAALSRLLGPDFEFVRKWDEPEWLVAYEFRSRGRTVVILWTRETDVPALPVPEGYTALDLMGSPLPQGQLLLGDVPVYLTTEQ